MAGHGLAPPVVSSDRLSDHLHVSHTSRLSHTTSLTHHVSLTHIYTQTLGPLSLSRDHHHRLGPAAPHMAIWQVEEMTASGVNWVRGEVGELSAAEDGTKTATLASGEQVRPPVVPKRPLLGTPPWLCSLRRAEVNARGTSPLTAASGPNLSRRAWQPAVHGTAWDSTAHATCDSCSHGSGSGSV